MKVKLLSHVQLFATPWTVTYETSPSMGFSRQEYWSGLPFPSPGDLPDPGIKPGSPALQADALTSEPPGKPKNTGRGCYFLLQGNFLTQGLNLCVLHWQEDFYNCVPWETQHKYSIIIIEPRSLQNGIHCKILSMLVSI